VEHFERATQLDPAYSDAWTGLGEAAVLLPIWEFNNEKAPGQFELARLAANKALTLNPSSGSAHAVLGYLHMMNLEWRDSFANYELALKHEPENAHIWHWYGFALGSVGKYAMAQDAYQTAVKLDPLSRIISTNAAEQFNLSGQYDIALDRIQQTLAFAPDFAFAWRTKAMSHVVRNEFAEARAAFQRSSESPETIGLELAIVDFIEESVRLGKPGQPPVGLNDPNLVDPYFASVALVLAGQYENALDFIEQLSASNIPHTGALYLNSALFQEKMGHIPRFQELVTRLATIESDKD